VLLLSKQRRRLCGLVVSMLVDDAQRTDDRPTTKTEVVAAFSRMFLAVQRLRQVHGSMFAARRLQQHSTLLSASNNNSKAMLLFR